jgi:ribosome-associated heat shock protein Hsp15
MADVESTRIDRWLWAVRLYKQRSAATDACRGGHVKLNGRAAKPAALVRPGDRIEAFAGGRERILEVVSIVEKRVGAPIAAQCLIDHSPAPPPRTVEPEVFATKRDRRDMERLRRR